MNIKLKIITLLFTSAFFTMCSANPNKKVQKEKKQLDQYSVAYFASGCFWCVEAIFESVKGVEEAVSGYSGGKEQNPTYQQVSAAQTGHAEAVKVYYDSTIVSYKTLVQVFYGSHDPTTINGQHPDYGKQYRSAIFYQSEVEKEIIDDFIKNIEASGEYDNPIVTEVTKFEKFWEAEEYHQNYEKLHPEQSYVKNVSIPRLKTFQKKFPELLKEGIH